MKGSKYITVGIAGHVDHGKTSLVYALTGIDTDRLKEEKRRGLSIESGIAPFQDGISFIDVPGHTDFLKNTIRGLCAVDVAILVVAADDGVMPQTIEHLQILKFFGVKNGFCVLSKADLVDEETLELAKEEIKELCKGTFLEGKPIIPFSKVDGRGLEEIKKEILRQAEATEPKNQDGEFRLWIDRVKNFPGFGTVVSGTIYSGKIEQGDSLIIFPPKIETKVRSLEVHHKRVQIAYAGQRVGINLHKVQAEKVKRGMVIIKPDSLDAYRFLNVKIQVIENAKKPIYDRQKVRLYIGASSIKCQIALMKKDRLDPGEEGFAQLRLDDDIPVVSGDPFVICFFGMGSVIGGGRVIQVSKKKLRKKNEQEIISYLEALEEHDIGRILNIFIEKNPLNPIKESYLSKETGISENEFKKEIKNRISKGELISFGSWGALSRKVYEELKERIPYVVEERLKEDPLRKSIKALEIRDQLSPNLSEVPLNRMLQELINENKLIQVDGGFRTKKEIHFSKEQEELISLILHFSKKSDIKPFSVDTFWKRTARQFSKSEIQRIMDYLCTQGKLIRLSNRRYISFEAMEKIKKMVKEFISKKGFLTPQDSKPLFGYGRNNGILIFEYLDSIGLTERRGDIRVLRS